jgi:hypothetical protein
MFTLFASLLFSVPGGFRIRIALHAQILALRHQFLVLQGPNYSMQPPVADPFKLSQQAILSAFLCLDRLILRDAPEADVRGGNGLAVNKPNGGRWGEHCHLCEEHEE